MSKAIVEEIRRPEFSAATSYTEQPGTGHLMMLEDPGVFCSIVDNCLPQR